MTISRPALRYHGGKFRLARWLLGYFPAHTCYVEPYGGAASVLLQKPRSYAEVYNDLDGDVVNYFEVLRDPELRRQLIEACVLTPYARDEFNRSWDETADPVERARRLCVRAQMGFGSCGATKGTTGFRIDTKREYGTAQQLWALFPDTIAAAGRRLAGVLIENRPALRIMAEHDYRETLHYIDPPYVHQTRVRGAGKQRYYRHEMTDTQHAELLEAAQQLKGMAIISGYRTELYDEALKGWTSYSTTSRIAAGRGGAVRTETIWLNRRCSLALNLGGSIASGVLP
jgi:DNA adenine methylase